MPVRSCLVKRSTIGLHWLCLYWGIQVIRWPCIYEASFGTILIPSMQVSTCIRLYAKQKYTEILRKTFNHPFFAKIEWY